MNKKVYKTKIEFNGYIESVEDLFHVAMDRVIPDLIYRNIYSKMVLNVGAGNKLIRGAVSLDLPEWNAETMLIPYKDETVSLIHCYHFLEHIQNLTFVLREFERILISGGVVNICVPYYLSGMAFRDQDHKRYFTEETWKTLFDNKYYDKMKEGRPWKFKIGIEERAMCLLTQLIKV